MKTILNIVLCAALLQAGLCGCQRTENLPEPVLEKVSLADWPQTDCSTSTRPVRDLVAYRLLGVPYQWEVDWMGGSTYIITPYFHKVESTFSYKDYLDKNLCSGTHGAYMNLIEGKTDVIIPMSSSRAGTSPGTRRLQRRRRASNWRPPRWPSTHWCSLSTPRIPSGT